MEEKNEYHDAPKPSGIGAALKAAREAAGLGLGEVADRLKLSLRQLDAIERDDFDSLPGATFVRGFVRNYARFLEVDPEPLMKALEQHFPSAVNDVANLVKGTTARELAPEPEETVEDAAQGGAGKWVALLLVAAALAGGGYWYANRESSPEKPSEHAANELAPMLTEQPSSPAGAASVPAAKQAAQAASVPVAAKPAASAALAVVAKLAAAKSQASAPAASGSDKVSINVKDAAWVSVQDADGRRLIYKVMQPGDPAEVTGSAPFKVVIGNASQVELSYNGKPVDLSDKIKGTTAKIQLK
ncbi:DUF4115 domain-containing protein [Chromobacterium phragmitis]|uniref:helix-turn-helix domain-containing protein n=1 Tax=Chromobacterium phragmitis TaxID=2202141 RepID=UPI000DED29FD|nr:RodZ domain-containing protein [Chromobacterium phragmitis]AXE28912.1 DUF4115 domain-containing protein [Chromobacterium phragmitis]